MQIRRARTAAGLSEASLAARIGIAPSRLNAVEGGSERLTARSLFEIARALDRSVAYFFNDLEVEPPAPTAVRNIATGIRVAETNALIAAFLQITDSETRRDIIRLVRGIASDL